MPAAFTRSAAMPQVPTRAEAGIEAATSTPEELRALMAHDIQCHAELVKAAGLVPQ
jgi:tripartite-type tricarboxylate transporter receptor subunit TctC